MATKGTDRARPTPPATAPPGRPSLAAMVTLSMGLHALVIGMGWAATHLWPTRSEPEPPRISARLVRLGEVKPRDRLPDVSSPPPPRPPTPAPPPSPSPSVPPVAAAAAAAPPAAPVRPRPPPPPRPSASVQDALKRLKKRVEGVAEGDADGEVARADEATLGDAFRGEIERCLRNNWVIAGEGARQLGDLRATLWVKVAGDGRLLMAQIRQGSGSQVFDDSVERAMRRCSHVSPPPPALRRQVRVEGIDIEFAP